MGGWGCVYTGWTWSTVPHNTDAEKQLSDRFVTPVTDIVVPLIIVTIGEVGDEHVHDWRMAFR